MTNSQTEFLDIPNEVIIEILNELNLPQQINCRLVSKRIRYLVDNYMKRRELIINGYDGYSGFIINTNDYSNGFYRLRSTNYKNSFLPLDKEHNYFSSPSFKRLFIDLKELHLNAFFNAGFNLEVLNQFTKLVRLFIYIIPVNKKQVLDLPNLKELAILGDDSRGVVNSGTIIRSKVEKLIFNARFHPFKFEHAESVLDLKYRCPFHLSDFKNVKTLRLSYASFDGSIESLDKLEEVHLGEECTGLYSVYDLDYLKSQKQIKRIYIGGIPVYNSEIEYDTRHTLQTFQILNYRILSYDLETIFLDYSKLIIILNEEKNRFSDLEKDKLIPKLPADFFRKFSDLRFIIATALEDENEFLNFLSKCKFINILEIYQSSISQSFLDQLPSVCSRSLNVLKLISLENKDRDNYLNFNFITKLEFIYKFFTDYYSTNFRFAVDAFRKCRYLKQLDFVLFEREVLFVKEDKKFRVRVNSKVVNKASFVFKFQTSSFEFDKFEFLSGKLDYKHLEKKVLKFCL